MHWKRLLIPSLLAAVLSVGLGSAASASGLARAPIEATRVSQASTPTPTPPITDPAVACASPATHPALPVLCALWQGDQLPDDAKRAIGHVILRLVNGQQAPQPDSSNLQARCEAFLAANPDGDSRRVAFCERVLAGERPEKPERPDPADRLARLKAECAEFLAAHPGETGPRVTLCQRVIAGELIEKPAKPQRDPQVEADKAAREAAKRAEHLVQLQAKCTAYLAEHPTETGARVEICRRILAGDLTATGKDKEIELREKQQSERGRDVGKRPQMLKPVAAR